MHNFEFCCRIDKFASVLLQRPERERSNNQAGLPTLGMPRRRDQPLCGTHQNGANIELTHYQASPETIGFCAERRDMTQIDALTASSTCRAGKNHLCPNPSRGEGFSVVCFHVDAASSDHSSGRISCLEAISSFAPHRVLRIHGKQRIIEIKMPNLRNRKS